MAGNLLAGKMNLCWEWKTPPPPPPLPRVSRKLWSLVTRVRIISLPAIYWRSQIDIIYFGKQRKRAELSGTGTGMGMRMTKTDTPSGSVIGINGDLLMAE